MDNLLTILKFVNGIVAFGVSVYAWHVFDTYKVRFLFVSMMLSFMVSTVLFFPEGEINDWLKHLPFIIGQGFFFLFVRALLLQGREDTSASQKVFVPWFLLASTHVHDSESWLGLATRQGLQHFITIPLFVLITAAVKILSLNGISGNMRRVTNYLILSGWSLTMIHLGEFLVESQGLVPSLEGDPIEVIEFVWFYIACIMLIFALKSYKTNPRAKNVGVEARQ